MTALEQQILKAVVDGPLDYMQLCAAIGRSPNDPRIPCAVRRLARQNRILHLPGRGWVLKREDDVEQP